jgi:Tfp pilus assembly protein PilF
MKILRGSILVSMAIVFVASATVASAASKRLWNACATGAPSVAIKACTTIIKQPDRQTTRSLSKAFTGRGYARWRKRQYKQALSDYTMAITLNPRNNTAYLNRGLIYRQQGQYAKAMADYKLVIKQGRRLVSAYYQLARVLENKGDKVNAAKAYRYAIKSPTARSADSKVKALARDRLAGLSTQPVQSIPAAQTCMKYQIVGNVSFCIPNNWQAKILRSKGSAVSQYRFESAELATIFVDWQYPEGDPRDDLGTTNYATTTLGGQSAIRYESKMNGANGILNQLIIVLDKKDAKGRQLTVLFETYGRREAVFRSVFETILKSFVVHSRSQHTRLDQGGTPLATSISNAQPTGLSHRFGNDCEVVDLPTWQHKTKQVLARRKQAHLKWVWLCRKKTYPVFGIEFDYDPRGQTKNFFYPLYLDLLKANGRWAYSIVDHPDQVIINITRSGKNGFSVDMEELKKQPANQASTMGTPQRRPVSSQPNRPITPQQVALPSIPKRQVLFDGSGLGTNWKPRIETKGKAKFEEVAKFANGALRVIVPEKLKWGQVGLSSKKKLLWLDQFGPGAERRLTFKVDPQGSTGFAVGLSTYEKTFVVKWVRQTTKGKTVLQIYTARELGLSPGWPTHAKPVWQQEVSEKAPREISLTIRPGEITVSGDGLAEHRQAWLPLVVDAGFNVHAYSYPESYDGSVKMVLKEIVLENRVLKPIKVQKPIAGVAPLPVTEFFGPSQREDWQMTPWQTYGKPSKNICRIDPSGFVVPHADKSGDGCDIHPLKKILSFDRRLESANYKLTAHFDPQQTRNFHIVLTPYQRKGQSWVRNFGTCFVSLLQSKAGKSFLSFKCGGAKDKRQIPSNWLHSGWNGKFTITFGKNWMKAAFDEGPALHFKLAPRKDLYVYIVAPDKPHKGTKARLLLTKLTGQWTLPHPMNAAERWVHIEKKEFDPAAFMKDLAASLPFPNASTDWSEAK